MSATSVLTDRLMNKMMNESVQRQMNQWKKQGRRVQTQNRERKALKLLFKHICVRKYLEQEHNSSSFSTIILFKSQLILFIWVNNSSIIILCMFPAVKLHRTHHLAVCNDFIVFNYEWKIPHRPTSTASISSHLPLLTWFPASYPSILSAELIRGPFL